MYTIEANNKVYTVLPHAAQRMIERAIDEAWVIETLEQGDMTEQGNGRYSYEFQKFVEDWQEIIIIQVITNEDELLIITIIDSTEEKED